MSDDAPLPMLELDGRPITPDEVRDVACRRRRVRMTSSAETRVRASRAVVDHLAASDEPIYGVNTGFGSLARMRIEPGGIRDVQRNLIRSHASGVMEPLPDPVVRAMLLLLAGSLARGHSGVRPLVIERLLDLLNHDLTPIVPSRGSVGASGDLAPLAHAALAMIGEGPVRDGAQIVPAGIAFTRRAIAPLDLEAKEGLALINGTHLMAAIGALICAELPGLTDAALIAAAMAIDGCRGTDRALDERLHDLRAQPGQIRVARVLRALLKDSQITASHAENDPRVQDPYSLRAAPQVIGGALDLLDYAHGVVSRELGAVTDNPLVFCDGKHGEIVSGGNFHGMPLALALDTIPMALATIAGIAERRIYWVLAASDPENPVRPYLSPRPGLHSGLMIAQYAAAACCNELQTLSMPASVSNIPTSAGTEDYNSFGPAAGLKALTAMELARRVVAIELLVMAEALEYQRPLRSGAGVEAAHAVIRSMVAVLERDRPPSPDIERIAEAICRDALRLPKGV